jgi:hypothetical protein
MNSISLKSITRLLAAVAIGIDVPAIANPPFTASPETTVITRPLENDGRIDYVCAINARESQGVTPGNNGYVTWLRALGLSEVPVSVRGKTVSMIGAQELVADDPAWRTFPGREPLYQSSIKMWKESEYPQFAAYLKHQDGSLALVVEAVAAPKWWTPNVSTNGTVEWILLPELNRMRDVSNALCGRALLRAKQGDFDGFLSDATAVKRLARRTAGWSIISHLVAVGIDCIANQTIGAAAGAGGFSGNQCAKLDKMLDGLDPIPSISESFDSGERWAMLDSTQCIAMGKIQLLATGNADSDRWIRTFKNMDTHSVDWDMALLQLNGYYTDDIDPILKAPSLRDEQIARRIFEFKVSRMRSDQKAHPNLAKEAGETNQAYTQRVADAIFLALAPSVWIAQDYCRLTVTLDQTTRALVAAAQYHADKGNWPDALDALIPDYLTQVPTDIFSTSGTDPVQYLKSNAGICISAHGIPGVSDTITIGIAQDAPADGL